MAASQISVQARVSGTWRMIVQPHVRVGGTWRECKQVSVKADGVWKAAWSNIDREINLGNRTILAADPFSPYDSHAGWRMMANGDLQEWKEPPGSGWVKFSSWRNWIVNDREYDCRFERVSGTFDTVPTEDSWIDLTSPATNRTLLNDRTTEGVEEGVETVKIRETVTAPPAGDDSGQITCGIENGGA